MMEPSITDTVINILVNGGAVGITIALIIYMWQKDKMFNLTLNNHFDHHTAALTKNAEALASLSKVIELKIK